MHSLTKCGTTKKLLALWLLTLLCLLALANGRTDRSDRHIRAKRGGFRSRQSDAGGRFSFSIPFLRSFGLGAPTVPSFPSYFLRRVKPRMDNGVRRVVPKVVSVLAGLGQTGIDAAKIFGEHAEPIVRESAAQWRRTVDTHIVPGVKEGLAFVGEKTVAGLATGVDRIAEVVMGTEAKEETAQALDTLTRAFLKDNGTDQEFEYADYDYEQYNPAHYQQYEEEATYNHPAYYQQYEEVDTSWHPQQSHYHQPRQDYPQYDEAYRTTYGEHFYPSESNHNPYYYTDYPQASYPDLDPRRVDSSNNHPNNLEPNFSYGTNNNPNYQYEYESDAASNQQTVEEALYVLGKNLLGRNVTDRLFPVAKTLAVGMGQVGTGLSTIGQVLPPIPSVEFDGGAIRLLPGTPQQEESRVQDTRKDRGEDSDGRITNSPPRCTTPDGSTGRCMDIGSCPILLTDLDNLRKSICFKSLFIPGVCCPDKGLTLVDFGGGDDNDERPLEVNDVVHEENNDDIFIQPQGTTRRPHVQLPSLADLSTTTPRPSPFLESIPITVPGTDQECGVSKIPQGRIVGGNATFEGEHPWMAAIYLHGNGRKEFWCGGALVGPNHVITAAHCTKDAKKRPFRSNQFSVRIGEWDLSDDDRYSQEFRVVDIQAHPDFKPNGFYNDVAVFTLDKPIKFSPYIQPVCLPSGEMLERDYTGSLPVVLGWGTTYYGGNEVSKLRGVALPVWTRDDCDKAYFQPITEVFLCAGFAEGGRDACQGDSGGPLLLYDQTRQRWMLLGIVSFGNRCAEPGYPGVYTKVTHFMPWILSKMV